VVHNAHHYALGLPRWATEWVMFVISVLGSMHAVQRNYLHHHKHCMGDENLEGYSAPQRLVGFALWADLPGSAACAGLPARTAPALDPGGAGRQRRLGVLRLRALRRLRALLQRGGHSGRPVHDLLLRRVDRAPRLRPLASDRTHPTREGDKTGSPSRCSSTWSITSSRKCRPVNCPGPPTGSTAPLPNCKPIRSSEPERVSRRASWLRAIASQPACFAGSSARSGLWPSLSARRRSRLVSISALREDLAEVPAKQAAC
jgi:hypothetical protein